jgi:aspartate kinase
MKFGGTSVGNASCIEKVVDIVRAGVRESDVVVVVSAMSGVTNKLVEAATQSAAGNRHLVATIFGELRERHQAAAKALIHSPEKRQQVLQKMLEIFEEGERLCQDAVLGQELTLPVRDRISGLGERISAPLLAAALLERGVGSEAIDASELVVTDSCHGAAEPYMELTRERCETRLRPLLRQGIVAVVTGFIGATVDGVPTTLGRNSSDYSGTILGAALDADEVILWTDVDGILSADPLLVPGARSILEMSYREASDLANSGAKVLYAKTLRPLIERGIPLRIRNTFAPDRPGTQITATGSSNGAGAKALTASRDVALITIEGPSILGAPDILSRTLANAAAVRADVRPMRQVSSSENELSIVVSSAFAEPTLEALRREFAEDLAEERVERITLNPAVAVVTVVGDKMLSMEGLLHSVLGALGRENLNVLATAQGSRASSVSFVVAETDMKAVLVTAHRELQLAWAAV